MSTAFWYLLLLVPVFAIVYVWWAYRNKAAAKEAASRQRLTAMVGIVEGARAARSAARKEQTAPAVVSKPATDAAAPPAAAPRFLTQPETLTTTSSRPDCPTMKYFRVSVWPRCWRRLKTFHLQRWQSAGPRGTRSVS